MQKEQMHSSLTANYIFPQMIPHEYAVVFVTTNVCNFVLLDIRKVRQSVG